MSGEMTLNEIGAFNSDASMCGYVNVGVGVALGVGDQILVKSLMKKERIAYTVPGMCLSGSSRSNSDGCNSELKRFPKP